MSDPEAVGVVLDQLRFYDGMTDAARLLAERAAGNVELRSPEDVAFMLDGLRAMGVAGVLTQPFVQEAARHVDVTRAAGVTLLLWTLGEMGEAEAAARIADRAVAEGWPSAIPSGPRTSSPRWPSSAGRAWSRRLPSVP